MSTLAIPPQRVRLYRALWDRWIIVLRILCDLGAESHPVTWKAIADVLLVDKKTSQKYLDGLIRDGQIASAGQGYMLTEAGMGVLLDSDQEVVGKKGKNPRENFSLLKTEEEVEDNKLKQLTTTSSSKLGKNPGEIFSPEVQLALQHLPLLFDGAEITQKGLPYYLHIEKVLGWIAYAYDRRRSLHSPCGLIYSKLQDEEQPSPYIKYMRDPTAYFPDEYLDAIGRYEKVCEWCENTFTNLTTYNEHKEECLYTRANFDRFNDDDEPDNAIPCGKPDSTITQGMVRAWDAVLGQLRSEMPRATFDTWVRDTVLVHCDNNKMQIATRNSYAHDWLESRLQSTIERLLIGIMNKSVEVEFVINSGVE